MSKKPEKTARKGLEAKPRESVPPPRGDTIDLEALAIQQGVKPIVDFDRFLEEFGDSSPEEETADEFIAALRRWRHQSRERKLP